MATSTDANSSTSNDLEQLLLSSTMLQQHLEHRVAYRCFPLNLKGELQAEADKATIGMFQANLRPEGRNGR